MGPNSARALADQVHREMNSSNGNNATAVKKEEGDEIQIVHVDLREPVAAPLTEPPPPTATAFYTVPALPLLPLPAATAAAACVAVRHLAKDAPPCDVDREYLHFRLPQSVCPRGCPGAFCSRFARKVHYKRHHYNIYYALERPAVSSIAKNWMKENLGDQTGNNRVCVRCVVEWDNADYYVGRGELLTHLRRVHPHSFEALVLKYAGIIRWGIPDAAMHPVLQSAMTELGVVVEPNVVAVPTTPTLSLAAADAAAAALVAATSLPAATVQQVVAALGQQQQQQPAAAAAAAAAAPPLHPSCSCSGCSAAPAPFPVSPSAAAAEEEAAPSPSLPLDAPPSNIEKMYWNGMPEVAECPRGCPSDRITTRNSRIYHYIKHHYNIYYALTVRRQWTVEDRWMGVRFGDVGDSSRACVMCADGMPFFPKRRSLARHIEQAHPAAFTLLLWEYAEVTRCRIPDSTDSLLHDFLQGAMTAEGIALSYPVCTTAADAAPACLRAAPSLLAPDAPPSTTDEEYWRCAGGLAACPRGCIFNFKSESYRKNHYKSHHYDVYYYLRRPTEKPTQWTPYDTWANTHFGNNSIDARVCLLCVGAARRSPDYRGREALIRHMLQAHPSSSLALARVYAAVRPPAHVRDEDVHGLLMSAAGQAD